MTENQGTTTSKQQAVPNGHEDDFGPDSPSKWERDLFRDALSNVNQTLRFQMSLALPIMGACLGILNIMPAQEHQALLNQFDRFVFLPVLLSMGVSYLGLKKHWYYDKNRTRPQDDIDSLYSLVKAKYRMAHYALMLQLLSLGLLGLFILLEFK